MARDKEWIRATFVEDNVYEMAVKRVARAFDLFDTVIVSFSGGKDSTVCLNLALEEARRRNRLPLKVMHFDEEAIPYETEEYVRRVYEIEDIDMDWWCLPIAHRNSCTSEESEALWHCWAPEKEELWVRPLPPEAKTEAEGFPIWPVESRISIPDSNPVLYPPRIHGSVGFIMGIRADESVRRRQAVTRKEVDNYIIDMGKGQHKIYPIYDWSTQDVWRAPKLHNWDYNRGYDLMELAGIAHHLQRIAPPYGEQPMQSLWMFHKCFPDVWDKLGERVPGARTAARYARGALYHAGQGGVKETDLPEGMTWEQMVMAELEKYPPDQKAYIAKSIQNVMRRHYKRTVDPILFTPHPVTGISWRMLLKIASKGDFKSRVTPKLTTGEGKTRTAMVKTYKKNLEREKTDE
jgi:predicted phosphoadenosine phosphosulfate sulfurtransferase